MSAKKFSAAQREAIWLAHGKKCAYTRRLLDVSNFHIDHIIPKTLAKNPAVLECKLTEHGLSDFDIHGYENLLPCCPKANLQKNDLELSQTNFFLSIAASKKAKIEAYLECIQKREVRGKAGILLQQCFDRGELTPDEISKILQHHSEQPEAIFELIEAMQFADATEVNLVAKADIEDLRKLPIRLGENSHIDGVTLTNEIGEHIHVRTCSDYDSALDLGYFADTNFDIKMSSWFNHQCGLLKALQSATTASRSFIAKPRVGVVDLALLPFSLFPQFGDDPESPELDITYQTKILDGTLVVTSVRQYSLEIREPEGVGQRLVEAVRADFNGDGIEDILLFEYCYATHGTLGFGGTRILTRKSEDAKFEKVF